MIALTTNCCKSSATVAATVEGKILQQQLLQTLQQLLQVQ